MTQYSAVCDSATGHVRGIHVGAARPANTAQQEFVPITEQEYSAISGSLSLPQEGGARWQKSGTTIVEREDPRPQLQITLDKTEAAVGELISFAFQVLDKDGVPISPNATRKLSLVADDGRVRHWRITVVAGQKSGVKAITAPGRYRFVSDGTYRVVGDVEFSVFEDF